MDLTVKYLIALDTENFTVSQISACTPHCLCLCLNRELPRDKNKDSWALFYELADRLDKPRCTLKSHKDICKKVPVPRPFPRPIKGRPLEVGPSPGSSPGDSNGRPCGMSCLSKSRQWGCSGC